MWPYTIESSVELFSVVRRLADAIGFCSGLFGNRPLRPTDLWKSGM